MATDSHSGYRLEDDILPFVYTCPLGLLRTDAEGRVLMLNGAASAHLMPWVDRGASLEDLTATVRTWDPAAGRELLTRGRQREAPVVTRRFRPDPDGGTWLELSSVEFEDGLSITLRDVSELVANEAKLAAISAEEATQRGRAEIASGILHDLGNALTGIGTQTVALRELVSNDGGTANLGKLADLLDHAATALDQALGPGKSKAVTQLLRTVAHAFEQRGGASRQSCERLTKYLSHAQELLSINRTYASGGDGCDRHDLKRVLEDLRDMTLHDVGKRGGEVFTQLPDRAVKVAVDRSKLMQILLNLVKNACEAWDSVAEHADPLRIGLELDLTSDLTVRISVADNGPGMPPEVLARVFEDGFSTKSRGSGVGLASCRRIAESFGGTLALRSPAPDQGAVATLELRNE